MLRKALFLFVVLILTPSFALPETIDVHIKGVDDGVKTTKQQDYKEAVLFAKREAIERAGVKVKSLAKAKDFIVQSDYIESKAEAVLLPGYNIIDVGYQQDGTYVVILIGKVKTSTPDSVTKEVGRDGSFLKSANGVVFDERTGLEWYAGPDRVTNGNQAKVWVESLNVAGGGWRMPTWDELKTLYHFGAGTRNMTPLLKTTGWWVWSGKARDSSSAWYFDFSDGGEYWAYRDNDYHEFRCFAVRSRK